MIFPSALLVEGSAPKPLLNAHSVRQRILRMLMSVSSLPLFMLFLFLGFAFLCAENLVHVGAVREQLPHLIA